jgi:hypothetical protein
MLSTQIDKMREAADQLVKVALDEATIIKPIVSLREGLDSGFHSQNKVLTSILKDVENMKSIVQSIETLKSGVGDLKVQSVLQSKQRSLEWGLSNCSLNSFDYYNINQQLCKSSDLAQSTLLHFRRGNGAYINNGHTEKYRQDDETHRKFREKFQQQLHELLGTKPRLSQAENGWAIYYE